MALVIRKRDIDTDVLLVRRPDDDDEFPGIWGLPAASCRDGEGAMAAAQRIGVSKLGTQIEIGHEMGVGSQEREAYVIEMTLLEAFLADCSHITLPRKGAEGQLRGVTVYTAFRWGPPSDLSGSAAAGSLCSQLLLADKGLTW